MNHISYFYCLILSSKLSNSSTMSCRRRILETWAWSEHAWSASLMAISCNNIVRVFFIIIQSYSHTVIHIIWYTFTETCYIIWIYTIIFICVSYVISCQIQKTSILKLKQCMIQKKLKQHKTYLSTYMLYIIRKYLVCMIGYYHIISYS